MSDIFELADEMRELSKAHTEEDKIKNLRGELDGRERENKAKIVKLYEDFRETLEKSVNSEELIIDTWLTFSIHNGLSNHKGIPSGRIDKSDGPGDIIPFRNMAPYSVARIVGVERDPYSEQQAIVIIEYVRFIVERNNGHKFILRKYKVQKSSSLLGLKTGLKELYKKYLEKNPNALREIDI